jgi:AAA+ superfamily predicted ATPase
MPVFRPDSTVDTFSTLHSAHWLRRIGLHLDYFCGPADDYWHAVPAWLTEHFAHPSLPREIPKEDIAGRRRWIAQYLTQLEVPDPPASGHIWQNIKWLSERLDLNSDEQSLVTLSVCMFECPVVGDALRQIATESVTGSYRKLAHLLDIPESRSRPMLSRNGKLKRLGFLHAKQESPIFNLYDVIKPTEILTETLCLPHPSADAMFQNFAKKEPNTAFTKSDFNHLTVEWEILTRTISSTVRTNAEGINILLYGTTGAGKTELARALVQSIGLSLFAVSHEKQDGRTATGNERLASYQVTQQMLAKHGNAVVMFDEAEDVLVHESFLHQDDSSIDYSKAWMNHLLESNPVPTIWIANRVDQADPAYRRRFDVVLKLNALPTASRLRLVTEKLLRHALSETLQNELAALPHLLPYHVDTLDRVLWHVRHDADGTPMKTSPDQVAGIWLRENAELFNASPRLFTPYVDGSAEELATYRFPFDWKHIGISEENRIWMARLLECRTPPGYAMLLVGPSGAGKSTFADKLAAHFDVPIVSRSIVDLLSWQLGATERHLRALFLYAQQTESVLLLEDVDAYRLVLQQSSFEGPHIEQSIKRTLLSCLSQYDGTCIATARDMRMVDDDLMRRFHACINLGCLSKNQNGTAFAQLCTTEALNSQPLVHASLEMLHVFPGDYVDALTRYRHQEMGLSVVLPEPRMPTSSARETLDPRRLLDLLKASQHARATLSA